MAASEWTLVESICLSFNLLRCNKFAQHTHWLDELDWFVFARISINLFLILFELHAEILYVRCAREYESIFNGRVTQLLMILWGQSFVNVGMCAAYAMRFYNFCLLFGG